MGRDKAFIVVDGEPLARRTALVLQAGGCDPVSLVGNQPGLSGLGLPVIHEPDTAQRHPLIGVAAALRLGPPLVMFAPCDLPRLTADAVAALLSCGGPCRAKGQPLLCILPATLAAQAAALAAQGAPVRALVGNLPEVTVPHATLHNANTPDDLA